MARARTATSTASARQAALPAVIFAALLGTLFVFGAGFAAPEVLHNAAHDARHSFAFPCH